MSYALVDIDTVKLALRIDHNDDDVSLDLYIRAASQSIVLYLKGQAGEIMDLDALVGSPPDLSSVPDDVTQATIFLIGHFYREPDGDTDKAFDAGDMPRPVKALLMARRDPALA